jgi:hypothetical protein
MLVPHFAEAAQGHELERRVPRYGYGGFGGGKKVCTLCVSQPCQVHCRPAPATFARLRLNLAYQCSNKAALASAFISPPSVGRVCADGCGAIGCGPGQGTCRPYRPPGLGHCSNGRHAHGPWYVYYYILKQNEALLHKKRI